MLQKQFEIVLRQVTNLWFLHQEGKVLAYVAEKLGVHLFDLELEGNIDAVVIHVVYVKVFVG